MGTQEGTPGTTRGTGVSLTRWGMRVLFGGNQLCFATSTRGTVHPMAPLFHSSGSRAARKPVSAVSFPHHPTTGHRRGHCVPDAALAPSHHPSSSSSITVGHPQTCPLPGPAPVHAGCVWVSQQGRTDSRMKRSCCPIAATSLYPGKGKTRMVSIVAGRGTKNCPLAPRCDGGTGCEAGRSLLSWDTADPNGAAHGVPNVTG